MPRPKNLHEARKLHISVPGDLWPKLDLHLHSAAEGRIPHAAYQNFFRDRVKDFFESARADLSVYLPSLPRGSIISGEATVLAALIKELEKK